MSVCCGLGVVVAVQEEEAKGERHQWVWGNVQMGAAVTDGDGVTAPISTVNMELNSEAAAQAVATLAEATLNHDGQIILTGEDGTQSGKWAQWWCHAQTESSQNGPF